MNRSSGTLAQRALLSRTDGPASISPDPGGLHPKVYPSWALLLERSLDGADNGADLPAQRRGGEWLLGISRSVHTGSTNRRGTAAMLPARPQESPRRGHRPRERSRSRSAHLGRRLPPEPAPCVYPLQRCEATPTRLCCRCSDHTGQWSGPWSSRAACDPRPGCHSSAAGPAGSAHRLWASGLATQRSQGCVRAPWRTKRQGVARITTRARCWDRCRLRRSDRIARMILVSVPRLLVRRQDLVGRAASRSDHPLYMRR
jgi:hypothetical protein